MSKSVQIIAAAAVGLVLLFPAAGAAKDTQAFGTLKKIDYKGQRMLISEYNWDNHEIVDNTYQYNVRTIQVFNIEKVTELKPGDEVELEWMMKGKNRFINKISKGTMPMEALELLWDPTMEFDVEVAAPDPNAAAEGGITGEGTLDQGMADQTAPAPGIPDEADAEEDPIDPIIPEAEIEETPSAATDENVTDESVMDETVAEETVEETPPAAPAEAQP